MAQQAIQLSGLRELNRALTKLPVELQRAAEVSVLRAGAKPIHKAAKANASRSKDSGLLQKSLGVTVRKSRKSGNYTARVGPRAGFTQMVTRKGRKPEKANPVKYAHLVEYGTSKSAAQPFIRTAIDSAQGEVMGAMAAGYDKHLTKVVKKIRSGK